MLAAVPLCGYSEILCMYTHTHTHTRTHWQEGMGSAVLVAAVTLPKEGSPHFPTAHIFPKRFNEVLKQNKNCAGLASDAFILR